jgi:hypothetical protein
MIAHSVKQVCDDWNARICLDRLVTMAPVSLVDVPAGPGIYALYDHMGRPRYIGITAKCLNDRICKRHAAGDGNSHKFSTVYNAGRMFHTRYHPATCAADGPIAKELRRLFVRAHCAAVAIPLPGYGMDRLLSLEAEVCDLAPEEMTRWNNARALEPQEPTELLDRLLANLGWPDSNWRLSKGRPCVGTRSDFEPRESKRWG